MNRIYIFFILFSFCIITYSSNITTVNVRGLSEFNGNKTMSYNNALKDAFRRAVEKGLGVWIKSNTEVKDGLSVKDQILSSAQGYVVNHEVISENIQNGVLYLNVRCEVAVDKIGKDIKNLIGRLKISLGNPSISFVLTTWEFKGNRNYTNTKSSTSKSISGDWAAKQSNSKNNKSEISSGVAVDDEGNMVSYGNQSNNNEYDENVNWLGNENAGFETTVSSPFNYDEKLMSKIPSFSIIDGFQQEFLEKGFDLKATDKAREIAGAESLLKTGVNITDRAEIIKLATSEGANFVARGEAEIISKTKSSATGNWDVTTKVGCEIIDVSSMDIVATYSNTSTASNVQVNTAIEQSIKQAAILAARKLSSMTIDKWQDRANNGIKIDILLENVKSQRSQSRPFVKLLEKFCIITNQANQTNSTLISVQYKGTKLDFENAIFDELDQYPAFSEDKFDGPYYESGKIIFKFIN